MHFSLLEHYDILSNFTPFIFHFDKNNLKQGFGFNWRCPYVYMDVLIPRSQKNSLNFFLPSPIFG